MKGNRPYKLDYTEELILLSYEALALQDIRAGKYDREMFLKKHATHVLEGLENLSPDEMVYGNGEKTKDMFLFDCALRGKNINRENYVAQAGNVEDINEIINDAGTFFVLRREKELRRIIDPERDMEERICGYFGVKFPIMENESVKKIAEKILDRIIEGTSDINGRQVFEAEKEQTYEEKLESVRDYIMVAIRICTRLHGCTDDTPPGYYFLAGIAPVMGTLYENNIVLSDNEGKDREEEKLWKRAVKKGTEGFLKNEILTLCARNITAAVKTRSDQGGALSMIPEKEKISAKDLNIHSIKKDIKGMSYEYFLQGILASSVAIFMKYMAADNYIKEAKAKLTQEAEASTNTVTVLKSELSELQKSVESLKKEKEELKAKLEGIQNGYDALPKEIQAENKRLKSENNDLRKEVYILRKEIPEETKEAPCEEDKSTEDIQAAAEAARESVAQKEPASVNEIPEWIYKKKYVFVCQREDIAIRLKNRYPESVITDTFDITTRNAGTVDAVVALTKDISHSDYLKYKQKCKNLGLPFIHSPSENVERIARDILESNVLPETKPSDPEIIDTDTL